MAELDPRDADPRVCCVCGEPVDVDGNCSGMRTMIDGVKKLRVR